MHSVPRRFVRVQSNVSQISKSIVPNNVLVDQSFHSCRFLIAVILLYLIILCFFHADLVKKKKKSNTLDVKTL
jgi:hypothetical protein